MTKYNVSDTLTHVRTRPWVGDRTGQASDARHARQGARAEWQNEALEAARSSHSHSGRAAAAAGRARECSRPRTQVRWLQRGLLGVEGRNHTSHRVRVCSRPADGLQLQHRVGHRRRPFVSLLAASAALKEARGSRRRVRWVSRALNPRPIQRKRQSALSWVILLGDFHAVLCTMPRGITHICDVVCTAHSSSLFHRVS